SATETDEMLKHMYSCDSLSQMQAFERHRRFRESRQSFEDAVRSGRPQTSYTVEDMEKVSAVPSCDFRIFPELARHFQDRRFHSLDEIKSTSLAELKDIAKVDSEIFQRPLQAMEYVCCCSRVLFQRRMCFRENF
ncbi:hypothetical protein TNCV_1612091, partial [Trichonephila clavipes]